MLDPSTLKKHLKRKQITEHWQSIRVKIQRKAIPVYNILLQISQDFTREKKTEKFNMQIKIVHYFEVYIFTDFSIRLGIYWC